MEKSPSYWQYLLHIALPKVVRDIYIDTITTTALFVAIVMAFRVPERLVIMLAAFGTAMVSIVIAIAIVVGWLAWKDR